MCIFSEATYRTSACIYAFSLRQGGLNRYTALSYRSSAGRGVAQSEPVSVCYSRLEGLLCIFCSFLSTSENQGEYTYYTTMSVNSDTGI